MDAKKPGEMLEFHRVRGIIAGYIRLSRRAQALALEPPAISDYEKK